MLDVDQGEGEERLRIDQLGVLLLRSKLPVDELEGVEAWAGTLERIVGFRLDHVGRRAIVEVNSLDMVLQVRVLQNHSVEVHLVIFDSARELLHGVLA